MGGIDHLVNTFAAKRPFNRIGRFVGDPFGNTIAVDQRARWREHDAMSQAIATIALVVAEYDEAIAFYRDRIGFSLVEDKDMGGGKRWVVLAPPGQGGARLLLARADGPDQAAVVGRQAGGRVMLFLETDDFEGDYRRMVDAGVSFLEHPRHEDYGIVAVFADLYGTKWDLIAPRR